MHRRRLGWAVMTGPAPPSRRDYAPAARRLVGLSLVLGAAATLAFWTWHQPFMARPRTLWEISRTPPPEQLPMPIAGVAVERIDGWADGNARGRVVAAGDTVGFVGNSGNARTTPPHLHYGIYGAAGVVNPLPRLRRLQEPSEPRPPR